MSYSKVYSNKEIHDMISGFANVFLVLGALFFTVNIIAPLTGGVFSIKAFIIYGSWVGYALCLKYEAKLIKRNGRIKNNEYLIISLSGIACMFLWFPLQYSLIAGFLYALGRYFLFKKQEEQIAAVDNKPLS